SMEVGDVEAEIECVEEDDDGYCIAYVYRLHAGRIGAVTVAPFQAIEGARVIAADPVAASATLVLPELGVELDGQRHGALVASAIPDVPPAEWFDDPHFAELTPLTITDDGQVFGHLAPWGVCHIGLPGCTTAPRGDDYSLFHLGTVRTTGGEVAVGTITMNTGHADTRGLSAAQASAHYDNTGTQVAYVRAGEDDFRSEEHTSE